MARPWNLGPAPVDFSTLGNLGSSFFGAYDKAQQQQTLADLGKDFASGNYAAAAGKAAALGDLSASAQLAGLQQKNADRVLQQEASRSFMGMLGGGVPATPVAQGPIPSATPVASPGDPSLPAGMRNNNPGNIKFVGQRVPGIVGPSRNTDQGDPQAVFDTPESGMAAAYSLAMRKYSGGKRSANDLIAGNMGWTPGNTAAAANVARTMGIRPDEDLRLDDPARAQAFMRALLLQEHGKASMAYTDDMIGNAVRGGRAPQQSAPVQVAQAAPQAGEPQADVRAPGAANVEMNPQGYFIPPGGSSDIPPNDPAPRTSTQVLMGAIANQNLPQAQRDLAKSIVDRRLRYSDENSPIKTENMRLQNEKLRREVQGEGATPLSAQERAEFGIPADQAAYKTRSGEIKFGPAGTKIVNEAQKGENKFDEELGKGQAKRFNDMISEGEVAQGRIADIQTLREASRRLGSQGSQANLKAMIGPYAESLGVKIDGLSDIQLYESITNRLAPQLRAPGSGSTSDIEFKGFMRAIGPLSNTPAAREMILDTFEAASRNDIARADIASRLARKEISRGQAEKELRSLPNPLDGFREFRKQNPDLVGQAIKEAGMRNAAEKRDPVKVASPEEARKLPSGTRIILPDGRPGQVP